MPPDNPTSQIYSLSCFNNYVCSHAEVPSEPLNEIKVKEEFIEEPVPFQEEILIDEVKTEVAEDSLTGDATAQMPEQEEVKNEGTISDVFIDPANADDIPEDSPNGYGFEGPSAGAQSGTGGLGDSSEADCSDEDSLNSRSSAKVPCPDCRKMVSRSSLRSHRLTHSGKKPFACNLCEESFDSMEALNGHQSMHSVLRPFACGLCSQRFVRSTLLKCHVLVEHAHEAALGRRLRYSCKQCPEYFPTKKLMREHSLEHAPKYFACGTCNKRFRNKSSLAFHERTHTHEKKVKRYACDQCPRTFGRSDYFERHKRCHMSGQAFVCLVCNMHFSTATSLKYHMRNHEHGKPKRYDCKHCDRRFREPHHLKVHLRTHAVENRTHSVTNRRPCPVCCKLYHKSYLPIHMRSHSEGSSLECRYCDKTFASKIKLTAHVKTHTNGRPYSCRHCGKSYCTDTALRNHEASHDRSKRILNSLALKGPVINRHEKERYPCTFVNCSRVFAREMLVEDHVRREHFDERTFRCSRCEEQFYSVEMLRDHERWKHQHPPLRHIESSSEDEMAVFP